MRFPFPALTAATCLAVSIAAAHPTLERIESTHNAPAWFDAGMIEADVQIRFGGSDRVVGTMMMDPYLAVARIEFADGRVYVFDGETAWAKGEDVDPTAARFDVLTWPYFLAAPFKLRDPGTRFDTAHRIAATSMTCHGEEMDFTGKLTFDAGVGDAPDDWYNVYTHRETGGLGALAYIVTFFGTPSPGEAEPHAIVYHDFEEFDSVTLSTRWEFYKWSAERGIYGDPLGGAEVHAVRMGPYDPSLFRRPDGAVEATLPGD